MQRRTLLGGLAISLAGYLVWGQPAWALGGTMPEVGQPAPDFSLPSLDNRRVSLSDYRGRWVVLYFYPRDFTSGCTLEARRFQADWPEYQKRGVQILGVSADSVDTHRQFCDQEGLTFPLLADTDGAVSRAYGSWLGFISLRHTFLIDPDGIIRARFVKVNPATHSQEVLATLDSLGVVG